MNVEKFYEYGYRITSGKGSGREVWGFNHGGDGTWTPWQPDLGITSIDLDDVQDPEAKIRSFLTDAKVEAVILRREVTITTGPVEER